MIQRNFLKYVIIVIIIVLLGSNIYLFTEVKLLNKKISGSNSAANSNNTVEKVDYDVSTNAVDVVKEVKDRVVGIQVFNNSRLAGSGSGVIYEVNGKEAYIITNHHVIDGAQQIEVVFSNGESAEATLVGSDQYGDIALLKLTGEVEMEAMKIGDSSLLDAGEPVLAIGSPLGIEYAGTVTQGIVSASTRVVSMDIDGNGTDDWDMQVIQTDASINPGNSGGPLINMAGELVGITSMKLSDTEGMGFALPINDVVKEVEQIKNTGKVVRPVLGISGLSISDLSSIELRMYRINTTASDGVYVAEVSKGSAADKGGIKSGDVIVKFDGEDITTYKSFLTKLYSKAPSDTVNITVDRNGENVDLSVTLTEG
ncbi:MAG: S1C family serine protease [Beduini sp.]